MGEKRKKERLKLQLAGAAVQEKRKESGRGYLSLYNRGKVLFRHAGKK